jgi:hypothetical protein
MTNIRKGKFAIKEVIFIKKIPRLFMPYRVLSHPPLSRKGWQPQVDGVFDVLNLYYFFNLKRE